MEVLYKIKNPTLLIAGSDDSDVVMILQCTAKTDNALCASPNGANATLYKCISMHCKNIQVKPSFGIIHQLDNSKLG